MYKKHYTSVISHYFGKFASKSFPSPIQNFINQSYVKLMGLDMSAFESPSSYSTLNKLFTRAFVTPPTLPEDKNALISGVDALITDAGTITEGKAYQIKGMSYDIDRLFGEYHRDLASKVEGGEFINFYLSPKDYHRYHMPMTLKILSLTHIPGKLYPVNFPLLRNMKDLFIENERVVLQCETTQGKIFYMVLVSALNVGVMKVNFEPRIQTNADVEGEQVYTFENLYLDKGDDFGCFEMGSTIVVISEKGMFEEILVDAGKKVKFGETIAKLA